MKIAATSHCTKGEGKYLVEWAAWLSILGVSKIFIFEHNNERDEEFLRIEKLFSKSKFVEFHEAVETKETADLQMDSMKRAHDFCAEQGINWLITLDLDEYPVITRHKNLLHLVESLPNYVNHIYFNWRLYGSSGELTYDPSRTHFEKFTKIAYPNHYSNHIGKSLVRVGHVKTFRLHDHYCDGVNLNGRLETLKKSNHEYGTTMVNYEIGWICHFSTRSKEEFDQKQKRGYINEEFHGKIPDEYWERRDMNEFDGPNLMKLANLINTRLYDWNTGIIDLEPKDTTVELGRIRKVSPSAAPTVPEFVSMWKLKTVLEVKGLVAPIQKMIDSMPSNSIGYIAIKNAWNHNADIARYDPGAVAIGMGLNLSETEMDELFLSADAITTKIAT